MVVVVVVLGQLLAGCVKQPEFRSGRQSPVNPAGPFQNCNGFHREQQLTSCSLLTALLLTALTALPQETVL